MLERFHSLKEAVIIFQVQNLCETDLELLTNADWKSIEAFITILKPLHDVTVELSSEKHASVSMIIPLINMLIHYYGDLTKGVQGPVEKELTHHIQNQLKSRFQHCETVHSLAVATMLDPRFKNMAFTQPERIAKTLTLIKDEAG
jgi:thiamine kinase-like enzyme